MFRMSTSKSRRLADYLCRRPPKAMAGSEHLLRNASKRRALPAAMHESLVRSSFHSSTGRPHSKAVADTTGNQLEVTKTQNNAGIPAAPEPACSQQRFKHDRRSVTISADNSGDDLADFDATRSQRDPRRRCRECMRRVDQRPYRALPSRRIQFVVTTSAALTIASAPQSDSIAST